MLSEHFEQIEALGLNLAMAALFLLIGLAIHDVLKAVKYRRSAVGLYGQYCFLVVPDLSQKVLFRHFLVAASK